MEIKSAFALGMAVAICILAVVIIVVLAAAAEPTLVKYTISNRTIIPPQTTEIDVEFSEAVKWTIAVEDGGVVYDWTGESTNPTKKKWDGTYETNGSVVPDGVYAVNITWTSTTGLGGQNNTETIMVLGTCKPTADRLGVEDTSGCSGAYVGVPVNIINVRNGPVQGIRLRVDYNEGVLNLASISNADLTSAWRNLQLGEDKHTMAIATAETGDVISNGSSGSVVLLNFSVIGSPGDTSSMNMTLIELANPEGIVGAAPAKNGTFEVSRFGSIVGMATYACNGTGIAGVTANLTNGSAVNSTVTNETGYYNFTDVIPGNYVVNVSKSRFWDNSTEVTVTAGETTTADKMLWLKGDLNNDGVIADAGDVVLMLRVSVGDGSGDGCYDLNGDGEIADAGDLVLILRASVRDIELL